MRVVFISADERRAALSTFGAASLGEILTNLLAAPLWEQKPHRARLTLLSSPFLFWPFVAMVMCINNSPRPARLVEL